jgi:hypothetical protein
MKTSNLTAFEERANEIEKSRMPLQVEMERADALMNRFAEINEVAAQKTIQGLLRPESDAVKNGKAVSDKIE